VSAGTGEKLIPSSGRVCCPGLIYFPTDFRNINSGGECGGIISYLTGGSYIDYRIEKYSGFVTIHNTTTNNLCYTAPGGFRRAYLADDPNNPKNGGTCKVDKASGMQNCIGAGGTVAPNVNYFELAQPTATTNPWCCAQLVYSPSDASNPKAGGKCEYGPLPTDKNCAAKEELIQALLPCCPGLRAATNTNRCLDPNTENASTPKPTIEYNPQNPGSNCVKLNEKNPGSLPCCAGLVNKYILNRSAYYCLSPVCSKGTGASCNGTYTLSFLDVNNVGAASLVDSIKSFISQVLK
jgi:hypothetical protein